MGTPIVLNEEIKTARTLIANGAAFTIPFNDSAGLVSLLRHLHRDNNLLVVARAAVASMANNYKSFDEAIDPVMVGFLAP